MGWLEWGSGGRLGGGLAGRSSSASRRGSASTKVGASAAFTGITVSLGAPDIGAESGDEFSLGGGVSTVAASRASSAARSDTPPCSGSALCELDILAPAKLSAALSI